MSILLLETAVQQYAWGKKGSHSSVATLKREQSKQLGVPFELHEAQPYAELWIGTHVNAPSRTGGRLLSDVVAERPEELLGAKTVAAFGGASLPFLLKILSVRQALSIQAHPDKALAERLFRERPDVYKDPNHKPEMTLALTPFEVLCGFRPLAQVCAHLASVPELAALVGEAVVQRVPQLSDKEGLRAVFSALMLASEAAVKQQVAALIARLSKQAKRSELEEAILRIHIDYPGDIGVMCPYVLNHFWLQPGEAIFLGANEPHA
jgi:mannose-6-phosphate isomerase